MLGELVRDQGRPRHLDHGADRMTDLDAHVAHRLPGDALRHLARELHLFDGARERDHDLGRLDPHAPLRHLASRFHDRAHLHLVDLGEGDAEPAAPVAEHGVGLLESLDARPDGA